MLSATTFWKMLDLPGKESLLNVMSDDGDLFSKQERELLRSLADKTSRKHINELPSPTSEMVELAKKNKLKAIVLYRKVFGGIDPGIGLREAKTAIEALKVRHGVYRKETEPA